MLIRLRLYSEKSKEEIERTINISEAMYVPIPGDIFKEEFDDKSSSPKFWVVQSRSFTVNPYGRLQYTLDLEPL